MSVLRPIAPCLPRLLALYVLALLALLAVSAAAPATLLAQRAQEEATDTSRPTTVILVRHAEKDRTDPTERDPALTREGTIRAGALIHVLGHSGLDAVYSTPLRRTRGTARPVAEALGLEIRDAPLDEHAEAMAEILRRDHAGDIVLVVGHSNTTPDLARALGADDVPKIEDRDYDELWVLTLRDDGTASFLPLGYGEPTP